MKLIQEESFVFDDLLIVPQYSDVASRSDVSTRVEIAGMQLEIPIIAANMDTICGPKMARAMHELGGLGIMHRFAEADQRIIWVGNLKDDGVYAVPSVGLGTQALDELNAFFNAGADAVCIDVAHGNCKKMHDLVDEFYSKRVNNDRHLIIGNFTSVNDNFIPSHLDNITWKIGIGPGSACETRVVAGVGMPQASAIMNCRKHMPYMYAPLIADGGIKKPADVAKAIGLGASAVMVGGYIAFTDEVPDLGRETYRGMASGAAQIEHSGRISNGVPEGKSFMASGEAPGSVVDKVNELVGGLRSAMSYTGAHNVLEYQNKVIFQRVTPATSTENIAHFGK